MTTLELGLIGNSRTSALVDKNARIVWWCYPYFDSDPVCCELMNPVKKEKDMGYIDIGFEKIRQADQYYERNSAVLVSRFGDNAHNVIEVIDFAPCFRCTTASSRPHRLSGSSGALQAVPASPSASGPA